MRTSTLNVCVLALAICYGLSVALAAPVNKAEADSKEEQVIKEEEEVTQNGETESAEAEGGDVEMEENNEDDVDTDEDKETDDNETEVPAKRTVTDEAKMAARNSANQLPPLDYSMVGADNDVLKPGQITDYLYKDDPYGMFDVASSPEKLVHSIAMRIYLDNDVTDFENIMTKLLTYGVITGKEAEEFEDAVAEELRQIVLAEDKKLFQAAKGVNFVKDPNPQYNEGLNLDYDDAFLLPQAKPAYKADPKDILDEASILDALEDVQKDDKSEEADDSTSDEDVKDSPAEEEEEPAEGQAITKEEPRDGGDNADSDFNNEIDNDDDKSDEKDSSTEEGEKDSNEEEAEEEEKEIVINNGKKEEIIKEKQEEEGEGGKEDEEESEEEKEVINNPDLDAAGEKEEKKMSDDLEDELREKYGYLDSSDEDTTTPNDVTTSKDLLQTEADADDDQLQEPDLTFPQLTPEEYDELAKEFDRRVEEYYRKGFLNRKEVQDLEAMVEPY